MKPATTRTKLFLSRNNHTIKLREAAFIITLSLVHYNKNSTLHSLLTAPMPWTWPRSSWLRPSAWLRCRAWFVPRCGSSSEALVATRECGRGTLSRISWSLMDRLYRDGLWLRRRWRQPTELSIKDEMPDDYTWRRVNQHVTCSSMAMGTYCPCLSSSVRRTPLFNNCCVEASRSEPNCAKAATWTRTITSHLETHFHAHSNWNAGHFWRLGTLLGSNCRYI